MSLVAIHHNYSGVTDIAYSPVGYFIFSHPVDVFEI